MFQTLAPGESVTASVNAARTHRLAGIKTAKISAIQGFKYITGATAPESTKDMAFCEATSSKSVTITPDQNKAAKYVTSLLHSDFYSRCNPASCRAVYHQSFLTDPSCQRPYLQAC
jgi:hypothetical protein